jgi:hypothetical protein
MTALYVPLILKMIAELTCYKASTIDGCMGVEEAVSHLRSRNCREVIRTSSAIFVDLIKIVWHPKRPGRTHDDSLREYSYNWLSKESSWLMKDYYTHSKPGKSYERWDTEEFLRNNRTVFTDAKSQELISFYENRKVSTDAKSQEPIGSYKGKVNVLVPRPKKKVSTDAKSQEPIGSYKGKVNVLVPRPKKKERPSLRAGTPAVLGREHHFRILTLFPFDTLCRN